MRVSIRSRVVLMVMAAFAFACPATAQDEERDNTTGYNAIIDNLDLLVDNYATFLARKYDLTEEQDEYTKYLLRERSHEFLEKHEDNLRGMIDRMFDVRGGGDMDPAELIEWGKQAGPIYEEAKRLIIQGNDEWREILTPEQQKTHDEDLRLMQQSFETTEEQLDRIISGEMTVEEFRSPSKARRPSRSNRRDARPEPAVENVPPSDSTPRVSERPPRIRKPADGADEQDGRVSLPVRDRGVENPRRADDQAGNRPGPRSTPVQRGGEEQDEQGRPAAGADKPESEWETYVREFIEKYQLDDEQTQKANAILDDCKKQRDRYMESKKDQLEAIDKQIAELKTSKDKKQTDDLNKLNDRKKKLAEPVDAIFTQQLKPRLERLPTRAQQSAAEAASKKKASNKKPGGKTIRKPKAP